MISQRKLSKGMSKAETEGGGAAGVDWRREARIKKINKKNREKWEEWKEATV